MRLETEQIAYRDGDGTLIGFLVIDAERAGKGPGVLVPPARVVVDSGAAVHLETEQIVYRMVTRAPTINGSAMHGFTHETATGQQRGVLYHAPTDARSSIAIQDFSKNSFVDTGNLATRAPAACQRRALAVIATPSPELRAECGLATEAPARMQSSEGWWT